MRKLGVILLVLAAPTLVVTFFWLTSIGWFNWIEGMRCAGAIIANIFAVILAFLLIIFSTDVDIKHWTDGWKMR